MDRRLAYSLQINREHIATPRSGTMNNQNEIREPTDAKELTDEALASVSGGKIVSKGVINSSAISLPKPAYPPTA